MPDVTFDQFKTRKLAVAPVDVSLWFGPGSKMYVKEISSADSLRMAKATAAAKKSGDSEAEADDDSGWFARCLCDKRGKRLLPDGYSIDHETTPLGLIKAIVSEALGINNISIEDAEKNLLSPDGEPASS